DSWKPFIAQLQRYRADSEGEHGPVHGLLVLAPMFYERDGKTLSDDPVNKRAARIAIARGIRLPVQYLLPRLASNAGNRRGAAAQKVDEEFENRVMMAWRDLAWKSLGCVDELREKADAAFEASSKRLQTGRPDKVL